MCDCTLEEKNEHAHDQRLTTTTTIFKKCTELPMQQTYYANERLHAASVANEKQRGRNLSSATIESGKICETVGSTKPSSSEGSIDSTDDSVNLQKSECHIDCEDAKYNTECVCGDENSAEKLDVERTLAIINLEVIENLKAIEDIIFSEGFEVQQIKRFRITPEQASEFYTGKYGSADFTCFVTDMTSGPLLVMVLARKQAIQKWQLLMGPAKVTEARLYYPDSIRAQQGRKSANHKHFIYGSTTREDAEREIHFFFPEFVVEPLLKGQSTENYLRESICSVLVKALAACCKEKPVEPILWLGNWLLSNNPSMPKQILQDDSE